ncbi:MAG: fused MFS/spermidine synthase [Thermodesulfobacteriota bacterium]
MVIDSDSDYTNQRTSPPARYISEKPGRGPSFLTRAGLTAGPYLFFLVSGTTALIYEVVWARMLVLALGNTTLAFTTILTSFMAGLGLGGWFWGRFISVRQDRALVVFGLMEIAVGLYALAFPLVMGLMSGLDHWLMSPFRFGYWLQAGLRFVWCGLALGPATFLMGGALAVIGEHVIDQPNKFGRRTALLYGLNTAGATAGALLAGFFLIRLIGHGQTVRLAAAANLVVGLAAWGLTRLSAKGQSSRYLTRLKTGLRSTLSRRPSPLAARLTLAAVTLSGFCALAYEVLWTRLLILVVDNSIYSFTIILAAVLIGLALGSLILAPLLRLLGHPLFSLALLETVMALGAFALPFQIRVGPAGPGTAYLNFITNQMPLIILLPCLAMGAVFPLVAEIYQARREEVGGSLGVVFSLNAFGGALGAAIGGLVFLPLLGLQKTSILLLSLNLAVVVLLLMAWLRGPAAAAAILTIALIAVGASRYMPADFFAGKYARLEPNSRLVHYEEGLAATACVFERPDRTKALYLNGMPELDTGPLAVRTFRLMGALPGLIHPRPQKALMVTFGAGVTAGTAAHFVHQIDCVDLVENYRPLAAKFAEVNAGVAGNSKFSFFVDDARHYLKNTNRRYSFIVCDSTHPRAYDSWVLYTAEFYRLARARLEEGGLFCQWAPFHGLTPRQYGSILRTFSEVFPHASLWSVGGSYSLLVGTPEKLSLDVSTMQTRLNTGPVRRVLSEVGLDSVIEILAHFRLGEGRLKELAAEDTILIRDDSPAHLFFPFLATYAEQFERWPEVNHERVQRRRESVVPFLVNAGRNAEEKARFLDLMRQRERRGE